MKYWTLSALVFLLAAIPSAAQETRWESPGGRFSLDFRAWGWSQLPEDSLGGALLGIEHTAFQAGGNMRTCFLYEESALYPLGVSQARLNAVAVRMSGAVAGESAPRAVTSADIGGVTVTDAIFEGGLYEHRRLFYIVEGQRVFQYLIACGAGGTAPEDVVANIAGMLATLRIHAGAPT